MSSTFLALVQQFYREVGYSGVAPSTVVGQTAQKRKAVDFVAEAEYEIITKWADWDFMWKQWSGTSTVAGTANYALPSDLGTFDLDSFYLDYTSDDHIKLKWISYKKWRKLYRQGTKTNAEPDMFTILPDKTYIYLEAPPNGIFAITADYWKTPTKLSGNTDTSPIPAHFERVIIERAKMFHAQHYEDMDLYNTAFANYNELLKKLEASELPDKQDTLNQAEPMVIEVD